LKRVNRQNRKKRSRASVERSLGAIVLSVLALPAVTLAACRGNDLARLEAEPDDGGGDAAPPAPEAIVDRGACTPVEVDAAQFGESGGCSRFLKLPCGVPAGTQLRGACIADIGTCTDWCQSAFRCQFAPGATCDDAGAIVPDADVVLECVQCATGSGRRPRGLAVARPRARTWGRRPLGRFFAEVSYLEAASVLAFADLERALAGVGAPARLRRACRRAAADERRHAAATERLARRFGGHAAAPRAVTASLPSLESLLLENVVEGCVGESYGALVAMWQGARAADPAVSRAMRRIAADEARHAALSWAVFRWGAGKLTADARRRLGARIHTALASLRAEADRPVAMHDSVIDAGGYPSPAVARTLVARFEPFVVAETERALGQVQSGASAVTA
jgi:hypothetical protein